MENGGEDSYNNDMERKIDLNMERAAIETIPLDDSVDRRELFGGMDQNLRNIEDLLGVTIIQRSDGLLIKDGQGAADGAPAGHEAAERVQRAAAILKEMVETVRKGEVLDQQKAGYITDLAENGIVIVTFAMESGTEVVVSAPEITSRGFVYTKEADVLMNGANLVAQGALFTCQERGTVDRNHIKAVVRDNLSDYFWKKTQKRPMILPIIMEADT